MANQFSAFDQATMIQALQAAVQDGEVKTDPETIKDRSYSAQVAGDHGPALAFVAVKSIADVQGTLKVARQFHLPVVTQNRFTSTVIGADAVSGAIILSTAKMYRILEINRADAYAVV